MKMRTGFVSNSSSSSFVIAVTSEDKAKVKIEMDLTPCVERTIKTIEELEAYFKEEHLWDDYSMEQFLEDEPYHKEHYVKMKAAIESGMIVLVGSGSSEEYDGVNAFIYNGGLNGVTESDDFKIIESDRC